MIDVEMTMRRKKGGIEREEGKWTHFKALPNMRLDPQRILRLAREGRRNYTRRRRYKIYLLPFYIEADSSILFIGYKIYYFIPQNLKKLIV